MLEQAPTRFLVPDSLVSRQALRIAAPSTPGHATGTGTVQAIHKGAGNYVTVNYCDGMVEMPRRSYDIEIVIRRNLR
jgi:hypothetical protein